MKKMPVALFVVLSVIGLVYLVNSWTLPKSERISRQMSQTLNNARTNNIPWTLVQGNINILRLQRAEAYLKEDRPDDAIEEIVGLLKETLRQPVNIYGQERPRISADWYFQHRYYDVLARAYTAKGDNESATKAKKKADLAKQHEAELRPAEEARKKREEQREKSRILD